MINFDKTKIREVLTKEQIFDILEEFGGDPKYTNFGIISRTICHNIPSGNNSYKLYYYNNTQFFHCYTGCAEATFDIFDLIIKIQEIQYNKSFNLNDAVRWIAQRFNIAGTAEIKEDNFEDWEILKDYERVQDIKTNDKIIILKEYDKKILSRFNYDVIIKPWIDDNISTEVMKKTLIGYYPGEDKITIPHFDIDNRFIGLRGRTLIKKEAELFGKYMPIKIGEILYAHPLGANLYGINWAKDNIKLFKKAIIFESEKSVLQYMTMFGIENSIAVACCGSSLSIYQFQLLKSLGISEIIIAFDKDFAEINDETFKKQTKNLINIHKKFSNDVLVSFIFDKYNNIIPQKNSPIETSRENFLKLYNNRIYLEGE